MAKPSHGEGGWFLQFQQCLLQGLQKAFGIAVPENGTYLKLAVLASLTAMTHVIDNLFRDSRPVYGLP